MTTKPHHMPTQASILECIRHGTSEIGRRNTLLILCSLLGKNETFIMLNGDMMVDDMPKFFYHIKRCKAGEPLQYLLGNWDFFGTTLKTDSRALIPRPETELLVAKALDFLHTKDKGDSPLAVLDMCTGSGCIAVAIAAHYNGNINITAADISANTLSLAQENGAKYGITFVQSDLFENITGQYDLIISNPPYITSTEMEELAPNVHDFEPHLALHGGTDGMDIYRQLVPKSLAHIKPGGALYLEIGPPAVANILKDAGYSNVELTKDYAGLYRFVTGTCIKPWTLSKPGNF